MKEEKTVEEKTEGRYKVRERIRIKEVKREDCRKLVGCKNKGNCKETFRGIGRRYRGRREDWIRMVERF